MKRFVCLLLVMSVIISHCSWKEERTHLLKQILEGYLQTYPRANYQDVYKLFFQIDMGPGHFIKSKKEAFVYLRQELETLETAGRAEPLLEKIDPKRIFIKVNLRTFKLQGLEYQKLAEAFYQSARYHGDQEQLKNDWEWFLKSEFILNIDTTGLERFGKMLRQQDFPPVHHSQTFLEAYQPAYRIVALKEWLKQFPGIKPDK